MERVLIANRGEIAVRIIHACHDSGRKAIAVYADADANALFVRLADEAYALPGTTPAQTYLNIDAIIAIARKAHADAVHPGYGFLSENTDFAQAVLDAGLVWIGPSPHTIRILGDKVEARRIAAEVGAPMAPGTIVPVHDPKEVVRFAKEHGLPIAIKAVHGGGGRGLKVVRRLEDVEEAFESATREAEVAFGNGDCFLERFLDRPRHVEVQILADTHGDVKAIGTRDCSLQRRNQKLIEEAPAPFLSDAITEHLKRTAVAICRKAGYVSAGTVEFLVADDGTMSFMEVNTRIQVEHPVTEMTTGIDLVAEQLRIADGGSIADLEPQLHGHAIEFRINAEDPAHGFVPFPGHIDDLHVPSGPGIRFDTGIAVGTDIPDQFDSMLAKLVVYAPDRDGALHRGGDGRPMTRMWIELDGKRVELGLPSAFAAGVAAGSFAGGARAADSVSGGTETADDPSADPDTIVSIITGTVVRWLVDDGATVAADEPVVVLEAMKMETQIPAPHAGILHTSAAVGAQVRFGDRLGHVESA